MIRAEEISSAKYTSKYEKWNPVCIIDGFKNKSEAMQCEWRLKHLAKRGTIRNVNDRISYLSKFMKITNSLSNKTDIS